MKLEPMPPNSSFTMMMAKAEPTMAIHQGAVGGRFRPRIKPVTRADRSPTRTGRRAITWNRYSAATAVTMDTASTTRAFTPKL